MSPDNRPDETTSHPQGDPAAQNHLLHQLNQPLTAISNYALAGCQLIDQNMVDPNRLRELFDKIARQSSRATLLSRELGQSLKTTQQAGSSQ